MRYNPNRPQDERARGQLRDAVVRGQISVPDKCERCGTPNRACSDGRRYLQAHHPDHCQPLDVEWLCPKCHRLETPLASGSRSGTAKLNYKIVQEAKRLYKSGESYTAIGAKFGVDRRTVSRAVNGQHWAAARSTVKEGEGG